MAFNRTLRTAAALSFLPLYLGTLQSAVCYFLISLGLAVLVRGTSRIKAWAPALFELIWVVGAGVSIQLAYDFLQLQPFWIFSAILLSGIGYASDGDSKSDCLYFAVGCAAVVGIKFLWIGAA